MLVTKTYDQKINRITILIFYLVFIVLLSLTMATELLISKTDGYFEKNYGFITARGKYFWLVGLFAFTTSLFAIRNYLFGLRKNESSSNSDKKIKYYLALATTLLYLFIGPFVVYLYYDPNQLAAIKYGPILLIAPFIPILIAILFYKLISDVEYIFNWKEFLYLTLALSLINLIGGSIFLTQIAPSLGESKYILIPLFLFLTILSHGFYDWLNTFIRDLLYGGGRGFNIITDKDVTDLVKDFHRPELLEINPFLRFRVVRDRTKKGQSIDAAQEIITEAIEYFKQKDFPRRTKMNLKYQILKMLTTDDSEEGQILWELGFEGYPMKIMSGENGTRKPLFKVESMSDYTATSRNAFIALKKDAIHDLGWRLSYLEKTHKKTG
ncbi:hypothetical protein HY844_02405 [Candidatus Berkelbacteria bacterium]|nr:hypothetical protein [Candidatus Berkelbacteria bacterium]